MQTNTAKQQLMEIAARIKEMREIMGWSIAEMAEICHKHGVVLAVDNAHGAYLKFLEESRFPTDLGADMCWPDVP